MLATLAIGSSIALAAANLYQRVKHRRELPWVRGVHKYMHSTLAPNTQAMEPWAMPMADVEPADAPPAWSEADSVREILLIGLTGTTAVVHLMAGGPLLVLNGVGFAGLLAAHYLAPPKKYIASTRGVLCSVTPVLRLWDTSS